MDKYSLLVALLLACVSSAYSQQPIQPEDTFYQINQRFLSNKIATTRLVGPNGFDQQVRYHDHGDYGLFESDIRVPLSTSELLVPENSVNSIVINGFRWPNNRLHFYVGLVSPAVASQVRDAVAIIAAVTDITFVEINSTVNAPYHVRVVNNGNACNSFIGDRRDFFGAQGYQEMNLFSGCGVATTVHEFLHALGMFHEQSRSDRDKFVEVIPANIIPDLLFNFDKVTQGATDIGSYDYASIMHYPFWAFNKNNDFTTVTIRSRTSTPVPFFNTELSVGDIAALNQIYPGGPQANKSVITPLLQLLID